MRLGHRLRSLAQRLRSSSPGALGKEARLRRLLSLLRSRVPLLNRSHRCTRTRVPLRVAMLTLSGCHFPLRRGAVGARLAVPAALATSRPIPIRRAASQISHRSLRGREEECRAGFAVTDCERGSRPPSRTRDIKILFSGAHRALIGLRAKLMQQGLIGSMALPIQENGAVPKVSAQFPLPPRAAA